MYELNEQISTCIRNNYTDLALQNIKNRNSYYELADFYLSTAYYESEKLTTDKLESKKLIDSLTLLMATEMLKKEALDNADLNQYGKYLTDENYELMFKNDSLIFDFSE